MALALASALTFAARAAAAGYGDQVIMPGTVMEVYAVGVPGFRFRVEVSGAGEASFPLLEPMNVTGKTLPEVREMIQASLPNQIYRQHAADGAAAPINILPGEILLDIVAYPPVYVTGDVTKPGEIEFRPDMTVRQALALAGGLDPLRGRLGNPLVEAAEIRGQIEGAWIEYVAVESERLGVEALLAGEDVESAGSIAAPLPEAVVAEIIRAEVARIQAAGAETEAERAHLDALIRAARAQLAELGEQQALVQVRLTQQDEATRQTRDLYQRRIVPSARLAEEERHLALVEERLLAVSSQSANVRRDIEGLVRQLARIDGQLRIDRLDILRVALVRRSSLLARIEALEEQLAHLGRHAEAGPAGPILTIHGAPGTPPRIVDADARVNSGDVVEVTLPRPSLTVQGLRNH